MWGQKKKRLIDQNDKELPTMRELHVKYMTKHETQAVDFERSVEDRSLSTDARAHGEQVW